jgi:hypothetical protein
MSEHAEEQPQLTLEQRQALREQFIEVYSEQQTTFDNSVRTLSSAGVAVTVSLAAALKKMPAAGKWAVGLFVATLALNLVSYATAQLDMRARLRSLNEKRDHEIEGNGWTKATRTLNIAAGLCFVTGAVLLAVFVGRSA